MAEGDSKPLSSALALPSEFNNEAACCFAACCCYTQVSRERLGVQRG